MTVNQLFREQPSLELTYRYCQLFGLSGIKDRRWFSKHDMSAHNTVPKIKRVLLDDLKTLYIRCKARSYLTDIDDNLAITILRQLLKTHGFKVCTRSVCKSGVRVTEYRISELNTI